MKEWNGEIHLRQDTERKDMAAVEIGGFHDRNELAVGCCIILEAAAKKAGIPPLTLAAECFKKINFIHEGDNHGV